ncbi:hypothetical protein BST63_07790 [Bradyrhizobium canariense]|uniref:Uncharacterized protein n=1 Tax=Bradyrhizobium canariense TaxID=255045 RepID=A0ABX3X8Q5_9BRAD|nr:hypothetical protein BSR47_29655 [Bradyrhizobium canariense]OSJ32486.1 hypothetical protein BST63_07790 [Bradyrhizobium canariense]
MRPDGARPNQAIGAIAKLLHVVCGSEQSSQPRHAIYHPGAGEDDRAEHAKDGEVTDVEHTEIVGLGHEDAGHDAHHFAPCVIEVEQRHQK